MLHLHTEDTLDAADGRQPEILPENMRVGPWGVQDVRGKVDTSAGCMFVCGGFLIRFTAVKYNRFYFQGLS